MWLKQVSSNYATPLQKAKVTTIRSDGNPLEAPANRPPVPVPDFKTVLHATPVIIGVVENDADDITPAKELVLTDNVRIEILHDDRSQAEQTANPGAGTATVDTTAKTITFTPNAPDEGQNKVGFHGKVKIFYKIRDAGGLESDGYAIVRVGAPSPEEAKSGGEGHGAGATGGQPAPAEPPPSEGQQGTPQQKAAGFSLGHSSGTLKESVDTASRRILLTDITINDPDGPFTPDTLKPTAPGGFGKMFEIADNGNPHDRIVNLFLRQGADPEVASDTEVPLTVTQVGTGFEQLFILTIEDVPAAEIL